MNEVLESFREELERQDRSPITIKNYLNDVDLFIRWREETYGDTFDASQVVQREITEYRSFLKTVKNASPATINRRLASLSKFFSWCLACGKSKINPVDGVKGIAIVDPGPKSLDSTSLRRLLREVHVHGNAKDIAILEILCGTGIRVGELVQITLSDTVISERKGSIHVRYGKGQSSREIPLNVDVRKALQNWLDIRPALQSQFLITSQRGGGMTPSGIWRVVKKYAAFTGIPELSVHQLRHTVLTRLVREFGTDLVTVAKISGHRNLKTLMRYCAPNQEDLTKAVEKLALTGA